MVLNGNMYERKEKIVNNIDILEEKEKEAIKDLEEYLHWEELQGFSMLPRDKHIETLLNLVSNLIAENKELKEENLHWKGQYHLLSRKIDVIPKSKVEELIEELEKFTDGYNEEGEPEPNLFVIEKIELLQELLDERSNTDE